MYVLVDLLTRPDQVVAWFESVRALDKQPIEQRFNRIGFAALDVTPAQFEDGRRRQLLIEPVGTLRPPPIEISGRAVDLADLRYVHDPWNLEMIGESSIRALGEDIKVGHIDTGIDPDHPLVRGHPVAFRTFIQNGNSVLCDDSRAPFDNCGHGTMTASVLCGERPYGVAPKVSLYVAAMLGDVWTDAMLVAAVDWMIEQQVRVVWLGVERPDATSQSHDTQMTRLLDKNILPVTAVGNSGPGKSSTPGNCGDGLSAGAVCRGMGNPTNPTMWPQSSSQVVYGDRIKPDVVTPGHEVYAALIVNRPSSVEYQAVPLSGTSIAGPHLTGLAAMCFDKKETLTAREVAEGIRQGSRLLGLEPERANKGVPWGPSIKRVLNL